MLRSKRQRWKEAVENAYRDTALITFSTPQFSALNLAAPPSTMPLPTLRLASGHPGKAARRHGAGVSGLGYTLACVCVHSATQALVCVCVHSTTQAQYDV